MLKDRDCNNSKYGGLEYWHLRLMLGQVGDTVFQAILRPEFDDI